MSPSRKEQPEIACRQVLRKESSVHSEQWTVLPAVYAAGVTPELLLHRYLRHIRRFTWSLIRPRQDAEGIEFRLLGKSLLRFQLPRRTPGALTLAICGGLLVQPRNCARGELTFICEELPGGLRVSLQLADYCPMLLGGPAPNWPRKWSYRLTQAAIHRLVTVRFLTRLHRDLAGRKLCCRVVRVRGTGENI
ncbi:MAG: hypothetical protein WDA20_14105 [Desulfuromonadales bacterium]